MRRATARRPRGDRVRFAAATRRAGGVVERDALRSSGDGITATQEEPTMANDGDPLDFDESERGERQPTSAESSEQHADTVERVPLHDTACPSRGRGKPRPVAARTTRRGAAH
jgi:hypothetical protein